MLMIELKMWRCDEITFLLKDPQVIQQQFPVCVNATRPKRTFVPVHASIHEAPINFGSTYRVVFGTFVLLDLYYTSVQIDTKLTCDNFATLALGMVLWLAILIHLAGTELYVSDF